MKLRKPDLTQRHIEGQCDDCRHDGDERDATCVIEMRYVVVCLCESHARDLQERLNLDLDHYRQRNMG